MNQYLGISMVVLVIGLVLSILARLVTGGILDEIERVKAKRFDNRCRSIGKMIKECSEYTGKYIQYAKEAVKMDKELGSDGAKYAKEAFVKAKEEFKKEQDL